MSKKIFCLALAMMLLVCSVAVAEVLPSRSAKDIVTKYVGDTSAYAEDFAINTTDDANGTAQTVLEALAAAAANGPVVNAFGDEVVAALAALLPEGVDAATLDVAELFEINIANYDSAYGDVLVSFNTLTAETTVAAVLGCVTADGTAWTALKAEVVDGEVVVTFTADAVTAIPEGAETVLAFLNTPVAE